MAISKITEAPTPLEEVAKINEIVDGVNTNSTTKANASDVVDLTSTQEISGTKIFTKNIPISKNGPALVLQATDVTKGTAPAENKAWVIAMVDSEGGAVANRLMSVGNVLKDDNSNQCFIRAYKPTSGSTAASSLGVVYPASGDPYAYCDPSDVAGSILTTTEISKASSSAYFRLGNGLLIQRGYVTVSANSEATVTFPKAFSGNNSYTIIKNYNSSSSSGLGDREGSFYSQTTTSAKTYNVSSDTSRVYWLAIGY